MYTTTKDFAMSKTSKFLSYILRHKPESIGLTLNQEGWGVISDIVNLSNTSTSEIINAVNTCEKQRFELSDNQLMIRANQGHSFKVDLGLDVLSPPDILYHGTATRFIDSILSSGLMPQSRQHVHLSDNVVTAANVGRRHGKVAILHIDAGTMHQAGLKFYKSKNGVWLTDAVPTKFIHSKISYGSG